MTVEGYEKLLLMNSARCTLLGKRHFEQIEIQIAGYYLAMGCPHFTGADQL